MLNALARTGMRNTPLLLRLFDALRRAPPGSWATQDLVRVADGFVRLELLQEAELVELDLLQRVRAELLAAPCGTIGGRGLASLALAASELPPLGDLAVWRRLAEVYSMYDDVT